MKSSVQKFIIDILAFVSFVFLTSTGVIIHYILPARAGNSNAIWHLDRHDWGDIHFYFAVSFLAILTYHLIQHWKWIFNWVKSTPINSSKRKKTIALIALFALLALAIAPIISPVENIVHHKTEVNHSGKKNQDRLKKDISTNPNFYIRHHPLK